MPLTASVVKARLDTGPRVRRVNVSGEVMEAGTGLGLRVTMLDFKFEVQQSRGV